MEREKEAAVQETRVEEVGELSATFQSICAEG